MDDEAHEAGLLSVSSLIKSLLLYVYLFRYYYYVLFSEKNSNSRLEVTTNLGLVNHNKQTISNYG